MAIHTAQQIHAAACALEQELLKAPGESVDKRTVTEVLALVTSLAEIVEAQEEYLKVLRELVC